MTGLEKRGETVRTISCPSLTLTPSSEEFILESVPTILELDEVRSLWVTLGRRARGHVRRPVQLQLAIGPQASVSHRAVGSILKHKEGLERPSRSTWARHQVQQLGLSDPNQTKLDLGGT